MLQVDLLAQQLAEELSSGIAVFGLILTASEFAGLMHQNTCILRMLTASASLPLCIRLVPIVQRQLEI
jgi:hypothetical protein